MALSLIEVAPPAQEPVDLLSLKRHLRVDWDDDDDLLAELLVSAREFVERGLNRATTARTLRATNDLPSLAQAMGPVAGPVGLPSLLRFSLPMPPLASVTLVEIERDVEVWQTLTLTTDYTVDPSNVPGRVWLRASALSYWAPLLDFGLGLFGGIGTLARAPRVRITYTAGYGATGATVPGALRAAIRRAAAHQYEHREAEGMPPLTLLPQAYRVYTL